MKLSLDLSFATGYKSKSQRTRTFTEPWVQDNVFCPNCGANNLHKFPNNRPVADFYCPDCLEQFELKSKQRNIAKKIVDGAYKTMIERISSEENPNFFFLTYDLSTRDVKNFLIIPKYFFTPDMIEKRKPLGPNAKRAGWQGCNILLEKIPESGKIFYVRNKEIYSKQQVLKQWRKTAFLKQAPIKSKGWLIDVLDCVDKIPTNAFTLKDVYAFETHLQTLHPENKFVRDKIRQQLQVLRDKGYISFVSRGHYRKNE